MEPANGRDMVAQFRGELLQDLYGYRYQEVADNFDKYRFGFDGVDRSRMVDVKRLAAYLDFVITHLDKFIAASQLFADGHSQALFYKLMLYRCLGHLHLRLREDFTAKTLDEMYARAAGYETGPSPIQFEGLFGPIRHHENVPTDGEPVALDAWTGNVAYALGHGDHRQYFFNRDGVRVAPAAGDYVIDGGACFGDTAVLFACAAGPEGRVFAFEPLPQHHEVIARNIDQNLLEERVYIVPNGLGAVTNHVAQIDPSLSGIANPGFSLASIEHAVPVITIDDFIASQGIGKMDFIKLDVEGYELAALQGAAHTLDTLRPKLAISLYHKPGDFFEIPLYLRERHPHYRFHLDHYTIHYEETVLFAVPED
ncbi:MAG: FkbM family methyltransferase [Sulfuritalea sp.]|nr:FkbM family methyltransferase [Sulfuritalea sp.]MBP6637402.1 FkbM family methyltransferase [Sulfuritalea sp.]MBP7422117.1 FkbM family methyltransferase [Sulfuritalea sp.]